jgi:predicted O-methyltransferase YrrM
VTNSLTSPLVRSLLDRLFQAAAGDDARRASLAEGHPRGFATVSAREQADAYQDMYIPVSPEGGRLLYTLIRASRPSEVVEFGASFGISTIYLGAAVRDNGTGRVVSTELNTAKVARARANIAEARLADVVTILLEISCRV